MPVNIIPTRLGSFSLVKIEPINRPNKIISAMLVNIKSSFISY